MADAWDDSDNEWELNDAPQLSAPPAEEEEAWSDEEGQKGPEKVEYRGAAGSRKAPSKLEQKMAAHDARNAEEIAADTESLALDGGLGDYTGSAAFDSGDNSLTAEQKRRAKKEAGRHTKNAQARAFLKDGVLRGGAVDEDAPSGKPLARGWAPSSNGSSAAGQPLYREEDAVDEVILTEQKGGGVADAADYMGAVSDVSLASGRVVQLNAAGPVRVPEGDEKVDKTQRTSKKELNRQKERQKAAEAEKARDDAHWEEGAKPEKKKGR